MRKFYLLLVVALLATSSAFADIIYELNEGQPNPYGWNSKEDMYNAFMADAGVTGHNTIEYYQSIDKGTGDEDGLHNTDVGLCNLLKEVNAKAAFANTEKWGWLENHIRSVFSTAGLAFSYHYGAGAFFICGQSQKWPKSPSFAEAGKDEAYLPHWEYCYSFPTTVTETTKLKNPWKENCTFAGWYTTADFSGNPVTTIDANTTGTLYAKWINNVFYELNGGAWNPYGWTSKEDMYNAFMADAGVTGHNTIEYYQSIDKGTGDEDGLHNTDVGLCNLLKEVNAKAAFANTEKWGWLENHIRSVFSTAGLAFSYHYGAGAFFICGQSQKWPKSPSFAEAGKDENYFPTWGYSYGNPSIIEGEYKLKNPYREGAWEFAGWYKNAECTGDPITTINADFAGTLYAKWNSVREGITYDLNGGSNIINNPYGWKSKSDMFDAFMADAGVTTALSYASYKGMSNPFTSGGEAANQSLGSILTASNIGTPYANTEKWGWLLTYIQEETGLGEVSANTAAWRYATAQFLLARGDSPAHKFDFTEAGKDEAYFKAWKHSYELINPKFPEENFTLYAAEKEGCTFQGWYDNRWFTGNAVTTVGATTNGTLYAHWSSIMGDGDKTLNTLHTHYFDGTYVYASTIDNKGSNKNLYNSNKANEYFSDNNPKGDRKDITLVQEDWVAISGLTAEDVNKEIEAGTAFTKGDNTTFPVIKITTANAKAASTRELNNYRVANFNIYADNAHVNNIWLVAPQAGEYCHLTGYVKAVSGNEVTLAASKEEPDAVEMTVNIAKLSAKSAVVAGAWYKFTGIVVNGNKALTFNATSSEDVSTGVEEAEIGSTIVRGMNGEIAVSVASPATVNVYTAGGALVATRNIADSDAIAVAPGFYVVKTDNTVVKVLVK